MYGVLFLCLFDLMYLKVQIGIEASTNVQKQLHACPVQFSLFQADQLGAALSVPPPICRTS